MMRWRWVAAAGVAGVVIAGGAVAAGNHHPPVVYFTSQAGRSTPAPDGRVGSVPADHAASPAPVHRSTRPADHATAPTTATRPTGRSTAPATTTTSATRPAPSSQTPAVPATTGLVATPTTSDVTVSARPGGHPVGTMRPTTFGGPTWRPVLARTAGWVELRRMGDGSPVGWVSAGAVRLASDPWQIVVDLATGQLRFVDAGRTVLTAPVAHGRPSMPTPAGSTFLAGDVVTTGADALEAPILRPTGEHSLSALAQAEFPALYPGGAVAVTAIHGWRSETTNTSLWGGGRGLPASHGYMRLPTGPATVLLAELPTGTSVTITEGD